MASGLPAQLAVSDSFGKVESHGIEAIPAAERHGAPRELAFLWAGAFVNYASLFTASLLTTYYGLGVWDGLAATVLGTVAAAVILGLLSNTGPRSGQPQIVYTRAIFGRAGLYAGAVLTLFLAVGWFAVDCVIAAQAGAQLLGTTSRLTTFALVVPIAAISVAVAIYGHQTIKVLEAYGAVVFAALSVALFIYLAPQFHWTQRPTASGPDYPGAFVLGFMTCFALVASWYPFASDYSRYLPASSSRRAVTLWPVIGVALPMILLGLFGLLLPTIDSAHAFEGVLALISAHAPGWVAVPFFVFVIVGEIWANYLDVYTAGLVSLAMGIKLERWQTALGCGILGTALASYAVLVTDFHLAYEDFLILTYLWAPAWAAVVLLSFFVFEGRARPRLALVAWMAGTAASLLFVNYENLFGNLFVNVKLGFFNDFLINPMHGADISGIVSIAVAAAVYWGRTQAAAVMNVPVALTVAGSDSGGGAGIQADLKTFAALGVYGTSAITAITAQNTVAVVAIFELSPALISAQIAAVVDDIGVDAAKTGMLSSSEIIATVVTAIKRHGISKLVVDPVMVAKGGARLLRDDAVEALRTLLLPLAAIITPNLPEAEVLLGRRIRTLDERRQAARDLVALGARAAVVKGGHADDDVIDIYCDGDELVELIAQRVATENTHGSGCVFSAAITAGLAKGREPLAAVREAKDFITGAIEGSLELGHGHGPVNPMFEIDR